MSASKTRFAWALLLAPAALLFWFSAGTQGQGKAVRIEDKVNAGEIRAGQISREVKVAFVRSFEGIEDQTTKNEATRQYAIQDWFIDVSGGKPTAFYRSYDSITGSDTSFVGEQRFDIPCADGRATQSFAFKMEGGKPKLALECMATVGEKEISSAASDNAPMLAPNREVSVGDSWTVPAENFMTGGMFSPEEKHEDAEISVTLEEVKKTDAGELAILAVRAKLKRSLEQRNSYTKEIEVSLSIEYDITGKAAYDMRSHLRAWQFTGTAVGTGKMSGFNTKATAEFKGSDEYNWGFLSDQKQENGSDGPDEVNDLYVAKKDKVAAGSVVISRGNGKIARLQEFDVGSRKVVKTLAALPGKLSFDYLALSKDRKRVAFRSTGNNQISLSEANVFVLELESGKLNQVTPHWATNDGIGQPLSTGKTGTVTGRIVWYDDELRRDRHDGLNIGWVRVDQTNCYSTIDGQGRFKLENVPAGTSLLIQAFARLPNYTNGKSRGWQFAPNACAMAATVIIMEEGTKDLGDWKIHPPSVEYGYTCPSFDPEGNILANKYPGAVVAKAGYPKRSWEEKSIDDKLGILTGAFSASPDGKTYAFIRDSSGGQGEIHFYNTAGKEVWSTALKPEITVSFRAESAWLADGSGWVCTSGAPGWLGKDYFSVPALLYANPSQKTASVVRKWPQLTGSSVASVALNAEGTVAYLVLHSTKMGRTEVYGDLWMWDSATDSLTRLTSMGDVLAVANVGR